MESEKETQVDSCRYYILHIDNFWNEAFLDKETLKELTESWYRYYHFYSRSD
jgi:hypothetical protein